MNCLLVGNFLFSLVAAGRFQKHKRVLNQSVSASKAAMWSPWELGYDGLPCLALTPVPYGGLQKHWPKCWAKAVEDAKVLATSGNCKLCDLRIRGSKPEAERITSGCSAEVTCSAARLGGNNVGGWLHRSQCKACYEGHGKLASVEGLNDSLQNRKKNPEMACLPCPDACKKCKKVSGLVKKVSSFVTGAQREFECIMGPIVNATTKDERCETPTDYKCEEGVQFSTVVTELSLLKQDFRATCEFPKAFDNSKTPLRGAGTAEDYTLTLKAGEDKTVFPPVLDYLAEKT